MTDNASEFCSQDFNRALAQLDAKHIYIGAGRPQSNGCVEPPVNPARGMLETSFCPLPDSQVHRPAARPRAGAGALQLRPHPPGVGASKA